VDSLNCVECIRGARRVNPLNACHHISMMSLLGVMMLQTSQRR
jgi:hypothetical protein